MANLKEKKLTTAARNALPKSDFVFKKDRKFPISDKSHARNALSRVSQHGTQAEKARVRAAVHRKFPGIGNKHESLMDVEAGKLVRHVSARERAKSLSEEGLDAEGFRQVIARLMKNHGYDYETARDIALEFQHQDTEPGSPELCDCGEEGCNACAAQAHARMKAA